MKKRILAMALACLMIFSVVSFVACDDATEEHAAKIADLESATAALQTAIDKNASDISAAVADFTAKLADVAAKGDVDAVKTALDAVEATADAALADAGENATAIEALEAAIAELKAAVEADATDLDDAIADFGDAIAEVKAAIELLATKAELEAATAALQEAIDANAGDIEAAIADFEAAIAATNGDVEAVETALAAVKATADAALAKAEALGDIDELLATIENVTTLCTQLGVKVEGLETALENVIKLNDWNAATEGALDAVKALVEARAEYDLNRDYYSDAEWLKIEVAYKYAEVCINRAPSVAALEAAVEKFEETADAAKLIIEQIADKLANVDTATLATLKAHYEAQNGMSLLDDGVATLIETADANLTELYNEYTAEYVAGHLPTEGAGSEITGQVGVTYQGYADALAAYKARKAELEAAELEAGEINALIADYTTNFTEISNPNTTALNALKDSIATWDATYFYGDFAAEKTNNSANYLMVKHADFTTLYDNYWLLGLDAAGCLEAFAESLNFEITLLSKTALDNSLRLYNAYTDKCKADGTSLDHQYDGHNGAYYLDILLTKTAEYNALVAEAQAAYDEVYKDLTVSNVTIYDAAAIEAMLAWYDAETGYGVSEGETLVFGETGYPLTTPVTEATYNALLEVEAACKALVEAKKAETAAVNALLAALPRAGAIGGNSVDGFVDPVCAECAEAGCDACNNLGYDFSGNEIKLSDKEAIDAARAAYDAWLEGTGDQDKIDLNSDLYVIDADEYTNLERAEYYMLNWVGSLMADTIDAVNALDGANPDEDAYAFAIWLRDMLVSANCGDTTCLTGAEYDIPASITAYELAVYKNDKLAEVKDIYDDMKADLESVALSTTNFDGSYDALCGLIANAANKTAVDDLITAWTQGAYAEAKAAYDLQVAKNNAKAAVQESYEAKVAEYEAAGKDTVTLEKFETLYTMTCTEINDATTIDAVGVVVNRWNTERVDFYD